MTRFERDLKEALEGNEIEVLKRRNKEIHDLERELKWTKNSFRRTCIQQDIDRLTKEYRKIDENF